VAINALIVPNSFQFIIVERAVDDIRVCVIVYRAGGAIPFGRDEGANACKIPGGLEIAADKKTGVVILGRRFPIEPHLAIEGCSRETDKRNRGIDARCNHQARHAHKQPHQPGCKTPARPRNSKSQHHSQF
jgi:hypothetical protein